MYSFEGLGVKVVREWVPDANKPSLKTPQDALEVIRRSIGNEDREVFVAVLLDSKNRVLGIYTISMGTLDQAPCHPREAFKAAIVMGAAGIIFAHNHPSGDVSPSPEDEEMFRKLEEAGRILGIRVLDFLIVNPKEQRSLKGGDRIEARFRQHIRADR